MKYLSSTKHLFLSPLFALPFCAVMGPALAFAVSWRGFMGPVIMLGGLIFVHELGHFLTAKFMKMPVEVFSLGIGPRLVGFKWRETDVRLSALPLGGYVKLSGYNPEEPGADDPYGFLKQPTWKRMLFYSGGVIANIIVCAVLVYAVGADQARYPADPVYRLNVAQGSAAEEGGLKTGDELLRVGSLELPQANWNKDIVPFIKAHPGQPIDIQVMRGGEQLGFAIAPRPQGAQGKTGLLGITASQTIASAPSRPVEFRDFVTAFPESLQKTAVLGGMVFNGFWRLASFQSNIKELGGPIAIAKMGSEAAKAGWWDYLFLTAFISMNLAVLNALPIPLLDGGHVCILAFERIRRKDLAIELKEKILTVGFYFMAALMVFVIALDIWRIKN